MINKNVNFEFISIAKHINNLFNDKLNVKCIRKLVRKSYTSVVPIANICSIGYPHDSRADNAAYRHDRRADNAAYRHDRRADSLSPHSHVITMISQSAQKRQRLYTNQRPESHIMRSRYG